MNKENASKGLSLGDTSGNMTTVKIKPWRKKENDITLVITQGIANGVTIDDSSGRTYGPHRPIKMKITASRNDIERLVYLCRWHPEEWAEDLWMNVFLPTVAELKHGKSRYEQKIALANIKREAALIYVLFSHICSGPKDELPEYFNQLILKMSKVKDPEGKKLWTPKTRRNAAGYAAFCMESYYSVERLEYLGVKLFSKQDKYSFKSFFNNYIRQNLALAEKYLADKERALLFSVLKIKYMKKENTAQIYGYHKHLSTRTDMLPCDEKGNEQKLIPTSKQAKRVSVLLYQEVVEEEPYKMFFRGLGLL